MPTTIEDLGHVPLDRLFPESHTTARLTPARPGFEDKFYDQFVPELIASYAANGGLNNRDAHNMPSTRAVGQICEGLLQLLFPGFHDDDAVHHGTLADLTHQRISSAGIQLEDQVR